MHQDEHHFAPHNPTQECMCNYDESMRFRIAKWTHNLVNGCLGDAHDTGEITTAWRNNQGRWALFG